MFTADEPHKIWHGQALVELRRRSQRDGKGGLREESEHRRCDGLPYWI
ncbi:hypothetical protein TELCIR_25803 [Teladorsagia circumcincta]|uniref:Uncharacterized protein n=1 Tax=Teladorsagia circumcincta TaxID=45464 RepID=A0A2G9T4J1_TELCI|nr:hypothetical protein TELCIR_25803 [Teladorsagia circumcincta]